MPRIGQKIVRKERVRHPVALQEWTQGWVPGAMVSKAVIREDEGVLVEGNGDKGESTRASEHEAGDLNVRRTILKKGALQRPR